MDPAAHWAQLDADGRRLADAAAAAGLDTAVPSCPEWVVRDLVRHIGGVHRWAARHVRERAEQIIEEDLSGPWPADDALVDWFREGHAALVDTLRTADPDVVCATFLPAPSPLAFWSRRQAHETAIHRVDAELAADAVTPFPPAFAADGIDELLTGFVSRPRGKVRAPEPVTLGIVTTDADAAWTVTISTEPVVVTRTGEGADCVLTAGASDLYRFLWNRGPQPGVLTGDERVLGHLVQNTRVRWS